MSSSNRGSQAAELWGTVYSSSGEHSLSGLEYTRSTAWSVEDETAYLARVRDRAGVMATKLLTDARREAEGIKRQAREQGYAKGLADAGKELEAFRIGLGETVGTVLTSIEEQCAHIFEQWKGDLTAVARLAVERVCGLELAENRAAILESLLTQSVALLDQRRELAIRVNPEDQAMLEDIVGMAKERFPDVTSWRVKADASITPGGMVVESESSLAEGRLESRRAAVDTVLDRLTLTDLDLPDSLIEPEPE